jgi:hypothetical protein
MVVVRSSTDPEALAVETVATHGGRLRHVYRDSMQGFAVQMSDGAARKLARDPRVALVEEDGVVTAAALQSDPPSWGLDRIDQRTLPLNGRYSSVTPTTGVNVYVIDSGIRATHVEFEGRAFSGGDFVDDDGDGDPRDVANDDTDASTPDGTDCHGHGTHVAGTIGGASVGVAKTAILWGLRVLGCDGFGTWSAVVAAVEKVTAESARPAVVNLSISGNPSAAADEAIRRSIASGITYVVAAGNVADDAGNYSPSRVAATLVVGASTVDDHAAFFSNWGSAVDLFAPGEEITSASIESDTGLVPATGTSMATAHVTGVVALYLGAVPSALPPSAHQAIINAATVGRIGDAGPGTPNRLLYSGFLLPRPRLTVTFPNAAVNMGRGSRQPITWTHNLGSDSAVSVQVSRDGGRTYHTIDRRVRNTSATSGGMTWVVSGPNTPAARVRVQSLDGATSDVSNALFTIADPYIRVSVPNGGETWTAGQEVQVRWSDNLGPTDEVTVSLSRNGGTTYGRTVILRTYADGIETAVVRRAWSTGRGRLRIAWVTHEHVADVSDATFTIRPES